MKKRSILVILAVCALLCATGIAGWFGVRLGSNHLNAQLADVRNADFFDDTLLDFPRKFESNIADFPFTKDEFRSKFVETTTEYYGMRLKVTAQNRTDRDITVIGLSVRKEKEDEYLLYFRRTPEAAVTIPAGTKEPKNVWFDMIGDDFEDEELMRLMRREFGMKLLYVDASTGVTRPEDADESQLFTEYIR